MDKAKYEQAIDMILKVRLGKSLKEMMSVAEDAWFAQSQAVRAIDHRNDEIAGEDHLIDLDFALEQWILELELIANAAQKIAKRANRTLHTGGSYPEAEIDSEGYGDYAEGDEAAAQYASTGSNDRRRGGRSNERRRAAGNGNKSSSQKLHKDSGEDPQRREQVSQGER